MDCVVRRVAESDREAVVGIFNYYVENSFAAYPENRVGSHFFETLKDIADGYPFYVVEASDKEVIGFGLLHPHHRMSVFRRTAELTYFILPEHTRKGLGKKLLDILVKDAKEIGIDTLLSNICSLNNVSLDFHRKNGFEECGRFKRVGRKFGKDFDTVWMQKSI